MQLDDRHRNPAPLLLLLLLLLRLLPLLLPSSPGARPGDTVRRPSPIVTRGADKRSIARTLVRSFGPPSVALACSSLAYQNHPPAAAAPAAAVTTTRFVSCARPPAWIFACVPRLYRGTDTEAANGTAARSAGRARAPPPESVSRCSISAAAARRRRGRPLGEVGRSTGRQGRLARPLWRVAIDTLSLSINSLPPHFAARPDARFGRSAAPPLVAPAVSYLPSSPTIRPSILAYFCR